MSSEERKSTPGQRFRILAHGKKYLGTIVSYDPKTDTNIIRYEKNEYQKEELRSIIPDADVRIVLKDHSIEWIDKHVTYNAIFFFPTF